ncbi:MAG: hypothetical protein QE271_12855 [Bacteriovoracaceae bacterium]|nr:hypothetical protein [Bacteriovoracaceae bacterium]
MKKDFEVDFIINHDKPDSRSVSPHPGMSISFKSENYLSWGDQWSNEFSPILGKVYPSTQTVEVYENKPGQPYKGQILTEQGKLYFKLFYNGELLVRIKLDKQIENQDTGFYIPAKNDINGYGFSGGKRNEIIEEKWVSIPDVKCEVSHQKEETMPDKVTESYSYVTVEDQTGRKERKRQVTTTTCKYKKTITWRTKGYDDQLVVYRKYRSFYEIVVEPDNFGAGVATFRAVTSEPETLKETVKSYCVDTGSWVIGSQSEHIDESCSSSTSIE